MHHRTETSVHIFWPRLASFGHLGLIGDPLIVSKFNDDGVLCLVLALLCSTAVLSVLSSFKIILMRTREYRLL